jgi:hypothetical protein
MSDVRCSITESQLKAEAAEQRAAEDAEKLPPPPPDLTPAEWQEEGTLSGQNPHGVRLRAQRAAHVAYAEVQQAWDDLERAQRTAPRAPTGEAIALAEAELRRARAAGRAAPEAAAVIQQMNNHNQLRAAREALRSARTRYREQLKFHEDAVAADAHHAARAEIASARQRLETAQRADAMYRTPETASDAKAAAAEVARLSQKTGA